MRTVCFRAIPVQHETSKPMHCAKVMPAGQLLQRNIACSAVNVHQVSKCKHLPVIKGNFCNGLHQPTYLQPERTILLCCNTFRDKRHLYELSCKYIPRCSTPPHHSVQTSDRLRERAAHHSIFRRNTTTVLCMPRAQLPNEGSAPRHVLQLAGGLRCWHRLRDDDNCGSYVCRLQPRCQ